MWEHTHKKLLEFDKNIFPFLTNAEDGMNPQDNES